MAFVAIVFSFGVPPGDAATRAAISASAHAASPPGERASRASLYKVASLPLPVRPVRPLPAGDEVVDGRGDSDGWHIYAASSGDGWSWRPLATLDPFGLNPGGERWIGRQCLTGDGKYVVAVVAPWNANNSPDGLDHGGVAYVVSARTGEVHPLVSGVSLYYFTPSCGPGSSVALTAFTARDESRTTLVLADAATASVRTVLTLRGQYADAVPAPGGGFFAAAGNTLVHLAAGTRSVRARTPGRPFGLVANAAGGVDFLVGVRGVRASVWHMGRGRPVRVGGGIFHQLALFNGRGGHTIAAGTTGLNEASGILALPRQPAQVEAVSLGGTAYSLAPAQPRGKITATPGRDNALPGTPLVLGSRSVAGAQRITSWLPTIAAPPTAAMPRVLGRALGRPGGPARGARAGRAQAAAMFTSTCAVKRNNVYLQAMQPSPHQVDWAANLAGRSLLTGSAARPAGYANLGLPGYSPSQDFPLPAPFGPNGSSIPREILEGIFAQESNFSQASWHSIQGVAGNPLIADYYGAGSGYVPGVKAPDCGYGIGQVTTGMHIGEMSFDLQRKVAVDYAENAAASAQILADKWNELKAAGIIANGGDPNQLEDWYLALWDYNSGLHPNTGSGPWGLGWANNPANPDYPYNRGPFLYTYYPGISVLVINYQDAATPGNWPYQEKIFGWIAIPFRSPLTGVASYVGTIQTFSGNNNVLQPLPYALNSPGMNDFCDNTKNQCQSGFCLRVWYHGNCDPSTLDLPGPCTNPDFECWWHFPDGWCSPVSRCNTGSWEYNKGDAEPPAQGESYPLPTCSVNPADVPSSSDIVDSQGSAINLQGCNSTNMNWHNDGTFAFSYGDPAVPGSQQTDMDVHQLGTGLGGHIWFTHTGEPTDANGVSLWGVTGTWAPNLTGGIYQVKAFVPSAGASATQANYTINDGYGRSFHASIDQSSYSDAWVSLGTWWLGPGATVSLTNLGVTSGGDLAFSGMAFVPAIGGSYVAMGDEYASGEGAPPYDSTTNTASNQCHRSGNAYPRQFFATFKPSEQIVHIACAGAEIANILPSGKGLYNEQPQLDQMPSNADLVTVTVGANDAGLGDVFNHCIGNQGCEAYYRNLTDNNNEDVKIAGLGPQLASLYRSIKAAAPAALIVAVTYPNIFMPTTSGTGCGPMSALTPHDIEWLISEINNLDNTIVVAAHQAGIAVLDERYAFAQKELCRPSPVVNPWVNPPVARSGAMEPTAAGYALVANDLIAALTNPAAYFRPYRNLRDPRPGTPNAAIALKLLGAFKPNLPTYNATGWVSTTRSSVFGGWRTWPPGMTGFTGCQTNQVVEQRDNDQPGYVKSGCDPVGGLWYTPYDDPATTSQVPIAWGTTGQYSLQVDHVIPVKDAWANSVRNWTDPQLAKDFNNDIYSPELITASTITNASKSDSSIEQWQPPNQQYVCTYAEMWVAIKYQWNIAIDGVLAQAPATTNEYNWLSNELNSCETEETPAS
jgi:hypothetical protein